MSEYIEFINASIWNMLWIITACVTGGLFLTTLMPTAINRMTITANEIAKVVKEHSAIMLDIREKNQFVQGHIPSSKNAPMAKINDYCNSNKISPEQAIILICENGMIARNAFKKLQSAGYKKLYILQSGLSGWRSANLPITKK